ncbi:MAG TPA: hypothetical protein VHE60_16020 [Pyrinomonadaceae bacterium]|nr:hypothetical protein [Pyrinomonadaceae bacterium]
MDEAMAKRIAELVLHSMQYQTAIFGMMGVIVGATIPALASLLIHCLKQRAKTKADRPRKELLLTMLHDRTPPHTEGWRNFNTLKHVIGADEETARRLLLEIGARGSEDGQDKWGLLKYHPLTKAAKGLQKK